MTRRWSMWPLVAVGLALLVGLTTVIAPIASIAAVAGLVVVTTALLVPARFGRFAVGFLGFILTGYAFVGKGFAYLGAPPLFVGEIALGLGLLVVVVRGDVSAVLRSPVVLLLIAFGLWSAAQTTPYLGTYGVFALRDGALWGYGAFTLIVATLLAQPELMDRALTAYGRYFWWLPFWIPINGIVARVAGDVLPRVPGTDIPFLVFKPGDAAVHLAGVALLFLLGLHRFSPRNEARRHWLDWAWWLAWLASLAVAGSASRGGFLAAAIAITIVLVLRRRIRWWKPALVTVAFGVAFFASDFEIDVGMERKISSRQLASNLLSIGSTKADISLEGTREWRLQWWTDILNYTVHGPYRWTGKGYGINLADDDGYQGGGNDYVPNRSPHNIQMTVLARSGIPGLVLWVLLQGTFVFLLARAYFRAVRYGWDWWARVNLWIFAYWIAILVNATFDVYIEGPQGGIWFWSIIGFGVAAIDAQRRQAAQAAGEYATPVVQSAHELSPAATWAAR